MGGASGIRGRGFRDPWACLPGSVDRVQHVVRSRSDFHCSLLSQSLLRLLFWNEVTFFSKLAYIIQFFLFFKVINQSQCAEQSSSTCRLRGPTPTQQTSEPDPLLPFFHNKSPRPVHCFPEGAQMRLDKLANGSLGYTTVYLRQTARRHSGSSGPG